MQQNSGDTASTPPCWHQWHRQQAHAVIHEEKWPHRKSGGEIFRLVPHHPHPPYPESWRGNPTLDSLPEVQHPTPRSGASSSAAPSAGSGSGYYAFYEIRDFLAADCNKMSPPGGNSTIERVDPTPPEVQHPPARRPHNSSLDSLAELQHRAKTGPRQPRTEDVGVQTTFTAYPRFLHQHDQIKPIFVRGQFQPMTFEAESTSPGGEVQLPLRLVEKNTFLSVEDVKEGAFLSPDGRRRRPRSMPPN